MSNTKEKTKNMENRRTVATFYTINKHEQFGNLTRKVQKRHPNLKAKKFHFDRGPFEFGKPEAKTLPKSWDCPCISQESNFCSLLTLALGGQIARIARTSIRTCLYDVHASLHSLSHLRLPFVSSTRHIFFLPCTPIPPMTSMRRLVFCSHFGIRHLAAISIYDFIAAQEIVRIRSSRVTAVDKSC